MRVAWFLPLAFVSGEHGFALFAPYLLAITLLAGIKVRRRRAVDRSELQPAPL